MRDRPYHPETSFILPAAPELYKSIHPLFPKLAPPKHGIIPIFVRRILFLRGEKTPTSRNIMSFFAPEKAAEFQAL
jgi:hypothetical protein